MIYSNPGSGTQLARPRTDSSREVESVLWLAAGAAWAIVALKAWSQAKRADARRRTLTVSNRLLRQVFPSGSLPH